ncbi:hypothetical protein [Peribacillus frigoritolerans]|uniref:hypothetical protein n=1 Tax=Peribacillus frigoritolerans TaxID=450367 RepID=UPI00399F31B1
MEQEMDGKQNKAEGSIARKVNLYVGRESFLSFFQLFDNYWIGGAILNFSAINHAEKKL